LTTSYFSSSDGGFLPGPDAVGPWSADMMHGRFFGGLAARALEREVGGLGWRVARLTVDLFRPAPMELVEVSTDIVRQGRRIRVADAVVTVAGRAVASVRAVALAEGAPPPGDMWKAPEWASPAPDTLPRIEHFLDSVAELPAWDLRVHEGGVNSSERSRVWTNDQGHLVDLEPMTSLVRAALSGDLASPLSNGSDAGIGYINGDYTLALARYPRGAWVGLETTTHLAHDGIAVGASTLYDLDGPFGTSTTTALANPILE
jgi:hypothetical protein